MAMDRSYPEKKLVKIERTKTEIRDDVAIRVYVELVLEEHANTGELDVDTLRKLSQEALTAGFVFFQERFEDQRITNYMKDFKER